MLYFLYKERDCYDLEGLKSFLNQLYNIMHDHIQINLCEL